MLLTNKKIAIIGGGPVGLTMARLLQQHSINVSVYERDKDPNARIWGGTLDLHEGSGQDALKQAGLLQDYFSLARPMGRVIANEQGKVLSTIQPNHIHPEINRNNLRKLLLNSLSDGTVIWNSRFTWLSTRDDQWLLHFQDQPDAIADLVIGANGGMSSLKSYVTDATIEDTGTYIIQGEVVEPEINCAAFYQLCNSMILMSAYNGNILVANPYNNGALTYNVIFKAPDEELNFNNTASTCNFLIERFTEWNDCYKELFQGTASFWGLPTRLFPLNQSWKNNRPLPITLIGDAAHLMPPFAGEGVNTGLKDALVLSNNLLNGSFKTIKDAIADYENQMFEYARAAQLQTSKNEAAMVDIRFSFQGFNNT